jgi:RNA polymerase sigma factor (sigma-70 family)
MGSQQVMTSVAQFFTAERKRLVAYVRRFLEDAAEWDGEDVVQDVALSLFSRDEGLVPIESLSAYVYESLRHRAIDYLRRRRASVSLDAPVDGQDDAPLVSLLADMGADVEKEVFRAELRKAIFDAIEGLPVDQKAVIIETELNGRSFRELSEEWGVPVGTLLARKSRGLSKVRGLLKDLRS